MKSFARLFVVPLAVALSLASCSPTEPPPTEPTERCGDGQVTGSEECDDGNTQGGDGCESDCTRPREAACPGASLQPPATGTCSVQAGDGNLLITGIILAPGRVYPGGQVLLDTTGTLRCVGCDCSGAEGAATATRLICPRGVVSPGLINPHDHITFQGAPPTTTSTERYEHRHDWRRGNDGHTRLNNGSSASAAVRWGELRQVLSGTTSVAGSGGQNGLLRNLDRASTSTSGGNQEGLGLSALRYETFPLDDSSGLERTSGCAYGSGADTAASLPADAAYLPHIAEGIETSARNEFLCTSGMEPTGNALLTPRTGVIHAVGLRASDIWLMSALGSSLIWSPRSNLALYGDTASLPVFKRARVNIALGTDWLFSGSMNLLRELRCADSLNAIYYNRTFSDEELWAMVTANAARATGTSSRIGRLEAGLVGDIAIFRLNTYADSPHRAVLAANAEDVVLTLRGGKPLYGEESVVSGLGATGCDRLDVCGEARAVCLQSETGESLATLQGLNASAYPLFFCGQAPRNEPSCTPERASVDPRWPASVSGSTRYSGVPAGEDIDGDGIPDAQDNCPNLFNPVRPMDQGAQSDADGDLQGDLCDPCPLDANTTTCRQPDRNDFDADGIPNASDNCPAAANPGQQDADGDGKGDACDLCPAPNPGTTPCPTTLYGVKRPVNGASPLLGQAVSLQNVLVTAVASNGFFLQVHPSDSGYAGPEYSGIFVFRNSPGVSAGDRLDMTNATVSTFSGQLQLSNSVYTVRSRGNALPEPVAATPAEVATGGTRAEALEGVLVRVSDVLVTQVEPPPGPGDSAPTREFIVGGSLRVNDYLFNYTLPPVGFAYQTLTGVLQWRQGNMKLEPRSAEDMVAKLVPLAFGPVPTYARDGTSGLTFPQPLTLTLSFPAPADTVVELTSSSPVVGVASSVTVPAGASSAQVPVAADLSQQPGTSRVTLTASLGGVSLNAQVQVLTADQPAALASLSPDSVSVGLGRTARYTVTLDVPPATDTVVTLSLSPSELGTVPATVTVPANALSATFDFTSGSALGSGTLTATLGDRSLTSNIAVVNAVTDYVVISEVAPAGPGGASDEFIELYNPTPAPVDVSGWRLQYKSATGTAYTGTYTLPAGSSIAARGYFLVVSGSYAGSVTADASWGSSLALSGTAGHVRLGRPGVTTAVTDPNVVDTLGYGSTANAPEGTPAPAPSASGSVERKANATATAASMESGADANQGNGYDSNNNSADFIVRSARGPQNRSSPPEP